MLLAKHNCFGLVEVEPRTIIVIVTAISNDGSQSVNRGFSVVSEKNLIPDGKKLTATFGALIEPKERNRIAFHDFSQTDDTLPLVGDIPEALDAVTKALKLVRDVVFHKDKTVKV